MNGFSKESLLYVQHHYLGLQHITHIYISLEIMLG
jgi:hypothetical protein